VSVCPSVSLSHQSNAAAACGGFAAERRTRQRYRSTAPGSSSAAARVRSTALSSKCGQCHVDSRIIDAEQTWVTFYFRPIKILSVFTACVEFVSGWQHARNYISTHWADLGLPPVPDFPGCPGFPGMSRISRDVPDFPGCPGFVPCCPASRQDQLQDAKCPGFQGKLPVNAPNRTGPKTDGRVATGEGRLAQ